MFRVGEGVGDSEGLGLVTGIRMRVRFEIQCR